MTTYCDYCNSHTEDTFKKTYSLVKNWFELILNYFIERWTNAFAEGVNNKIKLIKSRALGSPTSTTFVIRILVECAPNPT